MSIKIILADDQGVLRDGIRCILQQHPDFEVVGQAEDGWQALELIERFKPHIVILEVHMPNLNGIEVVRQMHNFSPATRALILTACEDDDYVLTLMEAGASEYLLKTAHDKELIDSIRSVYSGEPPAHPTTAMRITSLRAQGRSAPTGAPR